MLVVVNQPHIEISLNGDGAKEVLDWISKKFKVTVIKTGIETDSIPIEETTFYKEMEVNRSGHLLSGYRLKSGLTQKQLAEKIGVKQNMISEYESGKRPISKTMAKKISIVFGIKPEMLT